MHLSSIISSTGSSGDATPTINIQASTHRNTLPTGALIGIVIGICSMMPLAAFLLWLIKRRRRRELLQDTYADGVTTLYPIPFADTAAAIIPSTSNSSDDSDGRRTAKGRRQYLRNELRAAQGKGARGEEVYEFSQVVGRPILDPDRQTLK
ncbi:hypothetical protein B0H11DRAFT_2234362 [Mycena galericulata]|nr:hypothetical protein B0H11DRAFT_2234362 [Mycena galericulata]